MRYEDSIFCVIPFHWILSSSFSIIEEVNPAFPLLRLGLSCRGVSVGDFRGVRVKSGGRKYKENIHSSKCDHALFKLAPAVPQPLLAELQSKNQPIDSSRSTSRRDTQFSRPYCNLPIHALNEVNDDAGAALIAIATAVVRRALKETKRMIQGCCHPVTIIRVQVDITIEHAATER